MFGIIASRLFLNIAKQYFFIGRMYNQEMYRYYITYTRKLFDWSCNNVSKQYANHAISSLKPIQDYDCVRFKVCNVNYVEYLQNSKKCL